MAARRRMRMLAAAALLATAAVAGAEPSSNVAFTLETMALLRGADAEAGAAKFKKAKCGRCHGKQGVADPDDENPNVAAQVAAYTYKQLSDYKDGKRTHRRMTRAARKLSDEDMASIAAWLAAQAGAAPAVPAEAGGAVPVLVRRGDGMRLIPACAACHGDRGEGKWVEVPALAGQKADYLTAALEAYRDGERANDVYGVMRYIASEMSDEEIEQLSAYYAGLAPVPAIRAAGR